MHVDDREPIELAKADTLSEPDDIEALDDGELDNDDVDGELDDASESMYLKYCFEGAASLAELAGALRLLADDLDRRRQEGWRLADRVEGGWAHLVDEA